MKIEIGQSTVEITDWGSVVTLRDGTRIEAAPQDTDEYRERAKSLGYETALEMCQEHDLIHVMLCELFDIPDSPALLRGANGLPINELAGAEEDAVLAIQRFINAYRKEYNDEEIPF